MGLIDDMRRIYNRMSAFTKKYEDGDSVYFSELLNVPRKDPGGNINLIPLGKDVHCYKIPSVPNLIGFITIGKEGSKIESHNHPDCWEYIYLNTGKIICNGITMSEQTDSHISLKPGDFHKIDFIEESELVVYFSMNPIAISAKS
jgi:hypothetical protein